MTSTPEQVIAKIREALEWYGEQARLCRLIHSEGDKGRHALAGDGGKRAAAALQSAADTPAPIFASRHNDETGECEAVDVSPSGYQSIINRTIINRPTVADEMIERAEADVVPAVGIPIIASLQRHAEDRGVTTEIGQDMVAAIDVIRSLAAAQHQSNLRGEPLAYLVEWYDNGEHMRLQFDRKMEPWVCNCNPTVMPLYASPLPPVTMDTSSLSPSKAKEE